MIINVVGGSPNLDKNLLKKHLAEFSIGVDYGAYFLATNNFILDLAIGDFDSISPQQFKKVKRHANAIMEHQIEKDDTDTELALLHALTLNPTKINIFGVTGKRLDHFIGALNLFRHVKTEVEVNIYDTYNRIYVLNPGTHVLKKMDYQYISFFAYSENVKKMSSNGLKYELNEYNLMGKDSLCVSNEFMKAQAELSFDSGKLLVIESND
ncbi:thiamine diphosphokinase [Haloplasma contractile]|uniref:Thiamine diphosphokinase n=1 Tax=Haloplasma contractile SSD-17B TaxID=1033810 RepID=U2FR00_9MOLU|nr:thiamine diphosphokinase [Haloplasma contractile]ERJ13429.1 Thiamine pyrophosphokinase protein [Haloplasma contractile SSD-17B]